MSWGDYKSNKSQEMYAGNAVNTPYRPHGVRVNRHVDNTINNGGAYIKDSQRMCDDHVQRCFSKMHSWTYPSAKTERCMPWVALNFVTFTLYEACGIELERIGIDLRVMEHCPAKTLMDCEDCDGRSYQRFAMMMVPFGTM